MFYYLDTNAGNVQRSNLGRFVMEVSELHQHTTCKRQICFVLCLLITSNVGSGAYLWFTVNDLHCNAPCQELLKHKCFYLQDLCGPLQPWMRQS